MLFFNGERNLTSFSMNKNQYLSTVHIFFFLNNWILCSTLPLLSSFFRSALGQNCHKSGCSFQKRFYRNKMCKRPSGCMHHSAGSRGEARGASLQLHGLRHSRPPCLSPTSRVYSKSSPLNQWCHPTISSSVVPFSSQLQSFPASGSFQMSQFFTSGGQTIGVSASASVLPMNI